MRLTETNSAHLNQPRLHHVGIVVDSILKTAPLVANEFSLEWKEHIIHDPLQFVNVSFLTSNGSSQSMVELVEPVGPRSPVRKFAESGGGLHHVCYEVDDLKSRIATSQEAGGTLVRVPLPAVAFEGRKIAWILTAQKLLVEYLERFRG